MELICHRRILCESTNDLQEFQVWRYSSRECHGTSNISVMKSWLRWVLPTQVNAYLKPKSETLHIMDGHVWVKSRWWKYFTANQFIRV